MFKVLPIMMALLITAAVPTALLIKNSPPTTTQLQKEMAVMDLQLPSPKQSIETIDKPIKVKTSDLSITLEAKNTLVFRGAVTSESVSNLQLKLLNMSHTLNESTPIYLVLDTPGGSVFAGLELIDHLRAIPQKVHTITLFAASMGFQIVQNMDKRYITNQGTLMSHRARLGGLQGQLYGEFETRYRMIKRKVDYMDAVASKRMGIKLEEYKDLVLNEYWIHGFDSLDDQAADKVVNLNCGKSLSGTESAKVNTMFGAFDVTFSKCPLIRAPISAEFSNIDSKNLSKIKKVYKKLYFDKEGYVDEYILTNEYVKIFGL